MRAVVFYLVCLGLLLTLSLLAPIGVGILVGEADVSLRLSFYLLLGSFLFGGLALAISGRSKRVPQIGRLSLLVLTWVVLPFAGAIPIMDVAGLTFVDALFESVSGLTTTGSTTLKTVEPWSQAILFWRVQLQWIGGYLALLTIIVLLAPMGIGGLVSRSETLTNGADLRSKDTPLLVFAINLGLLYATLTILCFLLLFLTGTRAFFAITLAMSATSTGGFMPFDQGVDEVVGLMGMLVFGAFLIIGATSVFWHKMLLDGRWRDASRHRESYSVILLAAFITFAFIIAANSAGEGNERPIAIMVEAFMNASSLVATSGISSRPGYMTLLPLIIILLIIFVGGSAFSTSGGLKHYRVGGMLVQSWSELDRLVYPSIVRPSHFGSESFDIQLMKAIWSFFLVAIFVVLFSTLCIAASGVQFEAAITAAISSFATAGPIYLAGWEEPGTAAWPAFGDYSTGAKYVLMATMILGRLEVLGVIALFSRHYWRTR